jgi:hypothetical protein
MVLIQAIDQSGVVMNRNKTGLVAAFFSLLICFGTAHAAPAVLFSVDTTLQEKGLFSDLVQERKYTAFGDTGTWSDSISNLIHSSTGTMTAEMSGTVSFANGVLTAQQHGSMNYTSIPTFTFLGDNLYASFGITAYVLGAPGTAYTLTATSDATTVDGVPIGSGADYNSIGWANPGWFYYWGDGHNTFTWQGLSTSSTIEFAGQTYSKIHQVNPSLDSHLGFVMTNYWGGDSTATVDATYRFSITTAASVAPIPEPETYAMMLAGLGLLGLVTRRRRLHQAADL